MKALDRLLWAGFADRAAQELVDVARQPRVKPNRRAAACVALARRASTFGDDIVAAQYARLALRVLPEIIEQPDARGYLAHFLNRVGDTRDAQAILQHSNQLSPTERLLMANSRLSGAPERHDEDSRMADVNAVITNAGLAPIRLRNSNEELSIDNLETVIEPRSCKSEVKVSVVVAAYNAASHLSTAIESLLAQTWDNIEIIVVDDASTDGTRAVAHRYASNDSRVKVVACATNGGAYAARNEGMKVASGEFVTTHDADDWSHGQRIQIQVEAMLADPALKLTRTHVTRATSNLVFQPPTIRPTRNWVHPNMSSVMVRASTIDDVGRWDELRSGGDGEFYKRVGATFGGQTCADIVPEASVSFARVSAGSLTSTPATSLLTLHQASGARFLYRESFTFWQKNNIVDDRLPIGAWGLSGSEFWRPPLMRRGAPNDRSYDVVFVSDFREDSAAKIVMDLARSGAKVGILFQPSYDSFVAATPLTPLPDLFWTAVYQHGFDPVTYGEKIRARTLLIDGLEAAECPLDEVPEIEVSRVDISIDAPNGQTSLTMDGRRLTSTKIADRHGCTPTLVPLDSVVSRVLESEDL